MSSIQMEAEVLYKKCCVFLLYSEIYFRYTQAEYIKGYSLRKSWFKTKHYSYQESFDYINEEWKSDSYRSIDLVDFFYRSHSGMRDTTNKLIFLCQNGNPVTVTINDAFILASTYEKLLQNIGVSADKAVEIYEQYFHKD